MKTMLIVYWQSGYDLCYDKNIKGNCLFCAQGVKEGLHFPYRYDRSNAD